MRDLMLFKAVDYRKSSVSIKVNLEFDLWSKPETGTYHSEESLGVMYRWFCDARRRVLIQDGSYCVDGLADDLINFWKLFEFLSEVSKSSNKMPSAKQIRFTCQPDRRTSNPSFIPSKISSVPSVKNLRPHNISNMESDDDDLYGQDDHSASNGVPQEGQPSGEMKMEDLEEGEEEGEEVEDEDSDDVRPAWG
jgi:hypothetical protein